MTPEPLTDAELDSVSDVLAGFGDKGSINLEALDGFLTAVTCGPENVPLSECLRDICGDDLAVNEDALVAQPRLRNFVSLVARHREVIAHTLQTGDAFTPLLDDEEHAGALVPIFALAHEHDPDPKMRPYSEPVGAEMREKLIVGAAAGVMKINRYFTMERLVATDWTGDSTTYRRIEPKVGRNEPCPCGSGKKFKRCCGSITLH